MKSSFINRLLRTNAGFAPFALRVPIGIIFIAHGAQKLLGWFGGYGLAGTGQFMESVGLGPGYLMALLAGSAEFFGGIAILIGLLVRPAAAAISVTMLVAIFAVHWSHGLFASAGGFEYPFAVLGATVALMISGAGSLSFDRGLAGRVAGGN